MSAIAMATELIKRFEGCRLTAYPDPGTGGRPYTVGWGNTYINGQSVIPGQVITQQQADAALAVTVTLVSNTLARTIPGWGSLSPQRQAALISFGYNCGSQFFGSVGYSTISRTLREGRLRDIPAVLLLYVKIGRAHV